MSEFKGLSLHAGSQVATREAVFNVRVPAATPTYVPLSYASFIQRIEKQLAIEGMTVKEETLALAKEGQRLFGLMRVEFDGFESREYGCVIGFRNSYDKSISTAFVAGQQTFICDNLSFWGESTFERRHAPNLLKDLSWFLTETMAVLPAKFAAQS